MAWNFSWADGSLGVLVCARMNTVSFASRVKDARRGAVASFLSASGPP